MPSSDWKQRTVQYLLGEYNKLVRGEVDASPAELFWGVGALGQLGALEMVNSSFVLEYLSARATSDGGYGVHGAQESDPLQTLSAVQLCRLLSLDPGFPDDAALTACGLRQLDAALDGGVDPKRAFCALLTLALVHAALPVARRSPIGVAIVSCRNWDGAYGACPLGESHAGACFCCLAALTLLGEHLGTFPADWETARWLAERQQDCGGFNGRTDKEPDLCYSFWVLASLHLLAKVHWVDCDAARAFVTTCIDEESGGLARRPGETGDVYHTFFGLMALELTRGPNATRLDPLFALPTSCAPGADQATSLLAG